VSPVTSPVAPHVAPKPSPTTLPSLTPLRGLAALWVILYHFTWQYFPQLNSEPFTHAVAKGYLAVDLFFMLSGFVLTHVYLSSFAEGVTAKGYRKFIVARFARVYPLHLFILGIFVIAEFAFAHGRAVMPLEGPLSVTAIFANLFMLQGLEASELSWNYPAWSISLEFAAYLLFPLALPLLWHAPKTLRLLLVPALFGALVWLAIGTEDQLNQWSGPLALMRCLPEFFLGSLCYALFRSRLFAGLFEKDLTLAAIAAALVLTLHCGAPDLLILPLFLLLILAGVSNHRRGGNLLNSRPLTWLGDVSYSTYLVHGFVLYATGRLLPYVFSTVDPGELSFAQAGATGLAMLAVTFLLSAWTYRAIELRGRRFLRARLGKAGRPRFEAQNTPAFPG
jgi:peptidoglycan/LPS O-acetylase OafA/YrhL